MKQTSPKSYKVGLTTEGVRHLVWPLCSNWKSNSARNSCQQACFGVSFGWVRKWLTAELSIFTRNLDPNKQCLHVLKQWIITNNSVSWAVYFRSTFDNLWLSNVTRWPSCNKSPLNAKSEAERKYTAQEKRVVDGDSFLEDMETLLVGVQVPCENRSSAVSHLLTQPKLTPKQACWQEFLAKFDFQLAGKSSMSHQPSDGHPESQGRPCSS